MSGKDNEEYYFDKIMENVGNTGYFQNRFTLVFNFIIVIMSAMTYMNKIISLNVPDHWCHVPDLQQGNYTTEEWKNKTIPREINAYGVFVYSKCNRFVNISDNQILEDENIIKCDMGWDYDHTWYDMTATMQYNWVCDNKMVPTNTLAVSRLGEVIGSIVFGQLSDNYGRLPIFYLAWVLVIFGRVGSIFTANWSYVFIFFSFIGSIPGATVYQSTMLIALEISPVNKRAFINMIICYGWCVGMMIVPFLMWWLRDWLVFSLVTTVPSVLFLFSRSWIIESPRWLALRGSTERAIYQFRKIARANKRELPPDIRDMISTITKDKVAERKFGIWGLFSSKRLGRNSIILIYCSAMSFFMYICFLYNIGNYSGNPYLNYFYPAMAEIPSYIVGKYLCDKFGRKIISFSVFLFTSLSSIMMIFTLQNDFSDIPIFIICICLKTCLSTTFYTMNLQSLEIFPTCIRQTGISLGVICSNILAILAPYVVVLGTSVNATIPYIVFAICSFSTAVGIIFLPETLDYQLPETLKDGSVFGTDQDIWGRRKAEIRRKNEAEVPLNS